MSQPPQAVKWPAIIKLHADDELIFISDASAFASDTALHQMHVQEKDRLIDSIGSVYRIGNQPAPELTFTGSMLSLDEVEEMLRVHLSSNGTCCVSKFHANSIHEALMAVFA